MDIFENDMNMVSQKCLEATEAQLKAEKGKVQALTKTNNSLIANKRMQSSIPEVHVPNVSRIKKHRLGFNHF